MCTPNVCIPFSIPDLDCLLLNYLLLDFSQQLLNPYGLLLTPTTSLLLLFIGSLPGAFNFPPFSYMLRVYPFTLLTFPSPALLSRLHLPFARMTLNFQSML